MATPINPYSANCGGASNQLTFTTCVGNALYLSSKGVTVATVEAFCESKQFDLPAWYQCLCAASQSITTCYNNTCPNDATFSTAKSSESAYCNAASAPAPPKVTGTATAAAASAAAAPATQASAGVLPSGVAGAPTLAPPPGATSATAATTSSKSGAVVNGNAIAIVGALVFALFV
ncbi:hypothetical protein BDR26DRAFT_854546 [Obelidium mucronatum]|nr:hypothetical protein BDR26DRAFT_854546 [Obelidium mucronatum]